MLGEDGISQKKLAEGREKDCPGLRHRDSSCPRRRRKHSTERRGPNP